MKFGICSAPGALGEPQRLLDILQEAGADYVEWTVGSVMSSDEEFARLQSVAQNSPLKPEAFCAFLPPHHRITGPNVNLGAVVEYASEAMKRVKAVGGEIIVLGSGGARKVPAGFPMDEARRQFVEFAREIAPRAQETGVTIVIEPLNQGEDNLVTTVATGADFTREIDRPAIRLLADFFHMNEENENSKSVENAGNLISHTHLADTHRVAPGFAKDEADFLAFFGALKAINYTGRCSFEGKTDDLARQAAPILTFMRARYDQAGE